MQAQLQLLVNGVRASTNVSLTTGYAIPSVFGVQGVIALAFKNGLLSLGVDASPVAFEGIRDILVNLTQRVRYFKKSEAMALINSQF